MTLGETRGNAKGEQLIITGPNQKISQTVAMTSQSKKKIAIYRKPIKAVTNAVQHAAFPSWVIPNFVHMNKLYKIKGSGIPINAIANDRPGESLSATRNQISKSSVNPADNNNEEQISARNCPLRCSIAAGTDGPAYCGLLGWI